METERRQGPKRKAKAAMRSDREKIIAYVNSVRAVVEPELQSDDAKKIMTEANKRFIAVHRWVIKSVEEL
jgi:hypothetical protein